MADNLILEVADFEHDVLTGIYSEETGRPQPLRITIQVRLKVAERYDARYAAVGQQELHGPQIRRERGAARRACISS